MRLALSIAVSIVLMALAPVASAASLSTPAEWRPAVGDIFLADIESNTGYLIHPDGEYLPFIIASGQQKSIRYLGMTYFAGTPTNEWVAKEKKIQSDRVMFGTTGRFFRLYEDGKTYSHYGIHSFKYVDKWLQESDRYRSYGCLVVSEEMLNLIEATFFVNEGALPVITTQGPNRLLQELAKREQGGQTLWFSLATK